MKKKKSHGESGVKKFTQLILEDNLKSVLDIGSGDKRHFNYMRNKIPNVFSNDFDSDNDYIGNFNDIWFERTFDGIHAAHVLEHQPNPHNFLKKIHSLLHEGGWLCITVPPLKHKIVGGHVSLWNAGLVLYHLVLAGFDCKKAMIKEYDYNISIIVKKKTIKETLNLVYDSPDMNYIKKYIPRFQFTTRTNTFNGDIKEWNW